MLQSLKSRCANREGNDLTLLRCRSASQPDRRAGAKLDEQQKFLKSFSRPTKNFLMDGAPGTWGGGWTRRRSPPPGSIGLRISFPCAVFQADFERVGGGCPMTAVRALFGAVAARV